MGPCCCNRQGPLIGAGMSLEAIERKSHIFARQKHDHYVEPQWCSKRLFEVEQFSRVWDPCCGWGRIVDNASVHGDAKGSDIIDRASGRFTVSDFLTSEWHSGWDIVCNPPFDVAREFAERALSIAKGKVAMIWLWRRLPAAGWLSGTPLARVWLMTPRPSMPSGDYIAAGGKVGGGTQDFCWLVWDKNYSGSPEMRWLHRDGSWTDTPSW